jgi:hypothetical protein
MLQSKASKELGVLYSKLGKLQDAADSISKHFNLLQSAVKKSNDGQSFKQSELEVARCLVGISKGNLLMGSYVLIIKSDFKELLKWKLERKEFCT